MIAQALAVTLTLKIVKQFLHRTLQLMMLYYNTKFGCKWKSSLEATVESLYFDYLSPHCDLDIEDSEATFLHDIPSHDNTPPYQVWLKMVEQCWRYHRNKIGNKDRRTDTQSDSNISPPPHPPTEGGGKGGGYNNRNTCSFLQILTLVAVKL